MKKNGFVENEERQELRKSVAAMAANYGQDYYLEKARAGEHTDELWNEAGKLGFLGVNLPEEYETVSSEEPYKIVAALERDVKSANYPAAREEILNIVQTLPETLKQFLDKKDERGAAEYAGKGYLQIDQDSGMKMITRSGMIMIIEVSNGLF